jgi:repressor LexA
MSTTEQTYEALKAFIETEGYVPSIRELGAVLGLSSPDTVRERLLALERAGLIERVEGKPRAIRLVKP